ncbi:MAG: hypothetical protein QGH20_10215, partial [Candidatus Latescibacteria bacterium]|nr:hypothetical protein [Candidatus Latescibacterota bacterium]
FLSGHYEDNSKMTGCSLAMLAYQYAATKDPKVRSRGFEALKSMEVMQSISGREGLLVRGYKPGSELEPEDALFTKNSYMENDEWHQAGDMRWYGDVSSDCINTAIFGMCLYYDLAADDVQKELIGKIVGNMVSYMIDGGMAILDIDGEMSRWGNYTPDYCTNVEPLNAAQALFHLKMAYHATGEHKFDEQYYKMIDKHRYHILAENGKYLPQWDISHWDDCLLLEALFGLLRLEDDEQLSFHYRRGIELFWSAVKDEGNTLFTYACGEYTGDTSRHELAKNSLQEMGVDRFVREVKNSERPDYQDHWPLTNIMNQDIVRKPFPVNERPHVAYEWRANPYRVDGQLGQTGEMEVSGVDYLVGYWMGRYLGEIEPDE